MTLTATQAALWRLADKELEKIGGPGRITRNPDVGIRNAAKTEGTREWALMESTKLASPVNDGMMTDEYCQRLITILGRMSS